MGENGAGKSTLANILSGSLAPTSGELILNGDAIRFSSTAEARDYGIDIVHQHFMLVPAFTVRENLLLFGADLDKARDIPLDAVVGELSVGEQQRVEIARALGSGGALVLFDEPTAVLTLEESDALLERLRQLRAEGRAVVLITHRVEEALAVADRITVLRAGEVVGSYVAGEATAEELERQIAGGQFDRPTRTSESGGGAEDRLIVEDLFVRADRGHLAVNGVSFQVRAGEVLGIGGVDGNGQVELAEALVGIRPVESGSIRRSGRVAYIPPDRNRDGLALTMSVLDNLLIAGHRKPALRRAGLLLPWLARLWAEGIVRRFSVRPPYLDRPVVTLSGGNRQKVVVGRELDETPDVLIAVYPTRGLDVRSQADVHRSILDARAAGCAVVVVSADWDELNAISDRVFVLSRGQWREER
ncbi:MAG: sugar ABC transporter ATP-binding protein [Fimbriimonadales bacterium]|nr:MAG: sugar ABC transporter ATP-binding protein [Fimbriimonadales bacterium]